MAYNTGNSVPSTDAKDFIDNCENIDKAVNSLESTFKDRLGVSRSTYEGVTQGLSFFNVGTFAVGFTLTNSRQTLTYDGHEYGWSGVFPKVVNAGSTPTPLGSGGWIDRSDVTLRGELADENSSVLIAGKPASEVATQTTLTYFEQYGAVGDGVTDNTAAFAAAKAALGVTNECRLSEGKTYYFAGSRPDLSGLAIYAELGAKIKADANPNIKEMTLLSDVEFINTSNSTSFVKHKNFSHDYLVSAGSSAAQIHQGKRLVKKLFTDADISSGAIGAGNIDFSGSFAGSITDDFVTWSTPFASGEQGVYFKVPEYGVLYEVSVKQNTSAVAGSGKIRSAAIITDSERTQLSVNVGVPSASVLKVTSGGTDVLASLATPNGGGYALAANGSITLGIRIAAGCVEFYVNGTMLYKHRYDGVPSKIAFLSGYGDSNLCVIGRPVKTYVNRAATNSPVSIAIVGDSISYGAYASESYDEILGHALSCSGIGDVTSVNYAVSGSSTANWISGGSIDITTKDLSGVDYALVMLGTNDVQVAVSAATYEANMRSIISHIQSQGVVPVLGVFPVWTTPGTSGIPGETSNYAYAGEHRQIVKMLAAELDIPLADVCAFFGTNISLYGDNIHPREEGLVLVAASFAEAILDHKSSGFDLSLSDNDNIKSTTLSLVNSWVAVGGSQVPTVIRDVRGRSARLTGPITGGANGTTIATIPAWARPSFKRSFVVTIYNTGGAAYGTAQISVLSSGVVNIEGATTTPSIVWLDGVAFSI